MKKIGLWILFALNVLIVNAQNPFIPRLENVSVVYNVLWDDTTDNWEVIHRAWKGGAERNISQHPGVDWSYHAYQSVIYFISDRNDCYRCFHLYKTDTTGSNIEKVSDLRLEDSWMSTRKNGTEMIVSGRLGDTARYQLFTIDLQSGNYQRVTYDTGAKYSDPCYSPDGRFLVFSYKPNRRDKNQREELYLMPSRGGQMKRLTHFPKDDLSSGRNGYTAGSARFHPSGKYITYVTNRKGESYLCSRYSRTKRVEIDGKRGWRRMARLES